MIRFQAPLLFLLLLPLAGGLAAWARAERQRFPWVRFLAGAMLIVALTAPSVDRRETATYVFLVVDRSASITRSVDDREIERTLERITSQHADWEYGVLGFAEIPEIVTPLGEPFLGLGERPAGDDASRATAAVDAALSLLPQGGARQIVLLTDGRFEDDPSALIAAAQQARVPVSVIPVGAALPADVRLDTLNAPDEVPAGRALNLDIGIRAGQSLSASLAVYRNGVLIHLQDVTTAAGLTQVTVQDLPDEETGILEYKAVIKHEGDPLPENDTRSVTVRMIDRPTVLVVDGGSDSAVPVLLDALNIDFARLERIPPLSRLGEYRQVVLVGQPLADLTRQQVDDLDQFVRHLGGGLLIIQGEQETRGFTSGPIEPLLPVSFTVPERIRNPSLAVVYLLDRSSSMGELAGAKTKIRVLREATAASVLLLPSETLLGIVAFYDDYDWIYPLQPIGDGTAAYRAIARLDAFGGTDVYYALEDAVDQLIAADARIKHIILISDGQTTEVGRDYPGLRAKLAAHDDIVLSAIAVSRNPNIPFLETLVRAGHGALFYASDFTALPQITMNVTQRLSRSRFITGDLAVSAEGDLRSGLAAIPPIGGYVLTFPRATATTLLQVGDDPLLSSWRIGLGSVSVLNTDLRGVWSSQWLRWAELPLLFDRILESTAPLTTAAAGLSPSVTMGAEDVTVLIDARNDAGQFANDLRFSASLASLEESYAGRQVAPGLYQIQFPRPQEGGYAMLVSESTAGRSFALPLSVPYSREYDATGPDVERLAAVAERTGGRLLLEEPALDRMTAGRVTATAQISAAFLIAGLLLFLLDLALRWTRQRAVLPKGRGPHASRRR